MASSFSRIAFVKSSETSGASASPAVSSPVVIEDLTLPPKSQWISSYDADSQLQWQTPAGPTCGLVNAGNTCFMNSCLQCLAATPPLIAYLKSGEHTSTCKANERKEFCMTCWAAGFLPKMHESKILQPRLLAAHPELITKQFRRFRQEDSHEFLRCFLEKMHLSSLRLAKVKEGSSDRRDETDALHRVFGGWFCNQTHCPSCKYDSNRFDAFMDLSLEVGNGINSVEKALQHFALVETLDERNKWKCPRCNKHVCAKKQITIRKAPTVLTIQLKRFSYTPRSTNDKARMLAMMYGMGGQKLQAHVSFPDVLDISAALSAQAKKEALPSKYDLYGVLVHHGSSASSGHYFSYVKAPNGSWYCMNDESVSRAGWNLVQQQQAYILFYKRKEASPAPLLKEVAMPSKPTVPAVKPDEEAPSALDVLSTAVWKPKQVSTAVVTSGFAPTSSVPPADAAMLKQQAPSAELSTTDVTHASVHLLHSKQQLKSFVLLSDSSTSYERFSSEQWDVGPLWKARLMDTFLRHIDALPKIWATIASNERATRKACKGFDEQRLKEIVALNAPHPLLLAKTTEPSKPTHTKSSITLGDDDSDDNAAVTSTRTTAPKAVASSSADIEAKRKRAQLEEVVIKKTNARSRIDKDILASMPALHETTSTAQSAFGSNGWGEVGGWASPDPSANNKTAPSSSGNAAAHDKGVSASASGAKRSRSNMTATAKPEDTGRYADEEAAAKMTEAQWNALLDAGRQKKVKVQHDASDNAATSTHKFEAAAAHKIASRSALSNGKGYRKGYD